MRLSNSWFRFLGALLLGMIVLTPRPVDAQNWTAPSFSFMLSNGGGSLHLLNNPNDNRIYFEGFGTNGNDTISEMVFVGKFGQTLPLWTVISDKISLMGRVGIGTRNPSAPLHILGTAGPVGLLPADYGLLLDSAGTNAYKWMQSYGGPLALNPIGNNVGIGTTAPTCRLDVNGTIRGYGAGSDPGLIAVSNSGYAILTNGGTGTGIYAIGGADAIYAGGNITYTGNLMHASDSRYKTNVQAIDGALADVLRLRGVTFDYKRADFPKMEFPADTQRGFIAQEVQSILPALVHKNSDGYLFVDYVQVVPLLVEAIKEQQKQLDAVKAENKRLVAMETQLATLNARLEQMAAASAPRR